MTILPIYNIIALPGAKLWLQNEIYDRFTDRTPAVGERVTLLAQKEERDWEQATADNFQPIGVVGTVSVVNDSGFMCIDLQNRVNVEEITRLPGGSFSMTLSRRPDVDDLDREDAGRRLTEVKDRVLAFARGQQWENTIRNFAAHWDDLWTVGTSLSPWLGLPADERYALLSENSLQRRFDKLEQMLMEGLERIDVQVEAQSAQKENYEIGRAHV